MTSYTVTESNPVVVTLHDGSEQKVPVGCSWSIDDEGGLVIVDYYDTPYRLVAGDWAYLTEKVPGRVAA